MSAIVRPLNGPWSSASAGNVTVLVHDSGLIDTVRRRWEADSLPHLIDALEAAQELITATQPTGKRNLNNA